MSDGAWESGGYQDGVQHSALCQALMSAGSALKAAATVWVSWVTSLCLHDWQTDTVFVAPVYWHLVLLQAIVAVMTVAAPLTPAAPN